MKRLLLPLSKERRDDYDRNALVYENDNSFLYNNHVSPKIIADLKSREFQVYTGYYEWVKGMETPDIFLIGRGKQSGKVKLKIQGFYPYSYVNSLSGKFKTYLGATVEKVMFRNQHPSAVANYRKRCERNNTNNIPYEADIPYIRRFLCDCSEFFESKELIKPKIAILDIETDFPYNNDKIIAFSINSEDKLYFNSIHVTTNEHDFLLDLADKISEYDVLTGWNFQEFDMEHIQIAFENEFSDSINLDTNPHHYAASIDLKQVSTKMYSHKLKGGWGLDNTGKKLCGIGKRKISKNRHARDMNPEELMEYNCYTPDHDILTENGWMNLKELVDNKQHVKVATLNPLTDKVEYHYPTNYIKKYVNNRTMFKQDGKTINLCTTMNHNMYVKRRHKEKFELIMAKKLPKVVEYKRDFPYDSQKDNKIFTLPTVTNNRGRIYKQLNIDMDTWLEFLGWYISEGCCSKKYGNIYIAQSKFRNKKYCLEIESILKSLNVKYGYCIKQYFFSNYQMASYLRKFGLSGSKYIPTKIKNLPKKQLEILLLSLMKGDGHFINGRFATYTSKSNQLADDVQEIGMKCGYCVTKHLSTNGCYVLIFSSKTVTNDFTTPVTNRIKDYRSYPKYTGPVVCVTVPNHIIMVRQHGKPVWCGNCLDVIIPDIVDNLLGGMECHLQLSRMLGCKLADTQITAIVNDISILKAYHKRNIVLPSRPPYKAIEAEKKRQAKGEYAYKAAEPAARPGVYKNVVGVDLSAAYPSAVMAINASCETKDENGKYRSPDGIKFNEGNSVFIEELKRLMEQRYTIKRQLVKYKKGSAKWKTLKYIDFALKTQVAAYSHGIFGWARSRMKDTQVAGAICATARNIIDLIKFTVDSWGYEWVYSHTDSTFFIAQKCDAKYLTEKLNEIIKDFCKRNGWAFAPKLDFEGFYPKAYIHSPARKVLVNEDGEWDTTGCNFMRAEVPEPLAIIEEELIRMKLDNCTNDEMLKYIKSKLINISSKNSEELGLEKPLGKPIKKYGRELQDGSCGGYPYHIKAVKRAIDEYGLDIEVGDRFRILPVISNEYTGIRVLKWVREYMAYTLDGKLPDVYKIDYEEYLRSNLFGKIDGLFGMTAKELEKIIFDDDEIRLALHIRNPPEKKEEKKVE